MPEVPQAADDMQWMQAALALAQEGVGLASPNPTVGCVIVRDGRVVGRGFHQYEQRDHAEVVAFTEASGAARGATAYVTLEPCSHYGRTGPCAHALIEAGVARVVAATRDPNPLVEGRGLAMLREAGIDVSVGLLGGEARELNDAFAHFVRHRTPLVSLKIAASLDGAIAPPPNLHRERASFPITGAGSRGRVQELRHAHDALVTGIGTVLADDPLLTDRSQRPRRRRLLRIVLDSQLRLPLHSRILHNVEGDLLIITRSGDRARQRSLVERGARILSIEAQAEGGISLRALLQALGQQEITSVMIEGGAHLNRSALAADVVDKLYLIQAPRFLGPGSVPMLAGPHATSLPRLLRYRTERIEDDTLITGYIHDPWEMVIGVRE
ncbi:MAG TPA: bifunctional diaminohydroxyphosphoribosylaminopyrimidine deaminase/5-amino-6-(5-phosphoribosylamino)uracil reductase RibD [Acidobacteriaceae bacterium]|jgi:diaminohydroxyphosphoribosylaminopyrimidine deaminase/5-amino-6-(5-phosphoribosylamino)uracil reductase